MEIGTAVIANKGLADARWTNVPADAVYITINSVMYAGFTQRPFVAASLKDDETMVRIFWTDELTVVTD